MKQVRSHYSKEFKIKAVELSKERGSLLPVALELGINKETLRNWKKAYGQGRLMVSANDSVKQKSKEEIELARLRKELYEVKLERDILKKAVGIFSKSDK